MIHANATIATVLSGAGLNKNFPDTKICLNKRFNKITIIFIIIIE